MKNIGDYFELNVYGEVCCDMCNDIIHNHIDCPICEIYSARTREFTKLESGDIIECECGASFEICSESVYSECTVKYIGYE
jgi:hypothetical protein